MGSLDVNTPSVLRDPLVVPEKLLMGPGPANCPPRVLQAMSRPVLGHLHPECTKIMDDIKEGIRYIFQTQNALTLAVSASGHGGMEAVLCNLLEPGELVLIAVNGIWGLRAADMAKRYGARVQLLESEIGCALTFEEIETALKTHCPTLLFMTHGDSSTGVLQKLEGLGDLCHKNGCLLAVDTVAALGGTPFYADRWGIDAVYTGSQKVLAAPPGLSPISFSQKAQDKIFARKTPVTVYYWDMTLLGDYWYCFGRPRIYHHTVSSNLLYALREALAIVCEEGLETMWERHCIAARRLHAGITKMGLELLVKDENSRLPNVTTIKVPPGVDWMKVCSHIMKNHSLEISGGLGPTAGKVFRIGLMGPNATVEKVDFVLRVLPEAIRCATTCSNRTCDTLFHKCSMI